MALSLIPSMLMLGGFKFIIYMALEREIEQSSVSDPSTLASTHDIDRSLTTLGIFSAFLLFIGRQFFSWLSSKQIVQPETLLMLALLC